MEVSGVALRSLPCFSGTGIGIDTLSVKPSLSGLSIDAGKIFSGSRRFLGSRGFKDSKGPRKISGFSSCGFSDDRNLQYLEFPRCGVKDEKEKDSETTITKKKSKLIKRLARNLSRFTVMDLGLEREDGLIKEVKKKMISEATEALLSQLRQLKAEEKEMKKERKEEKIKLKDARLKAKAVCDLSLNSTSESSGSDSDYLSRLRIGAMAEQKVDEQSITIQGETKTITQYQKILEVKESENRSNNSIMVEVCMGGKCKNSGSESLMEEFEKWVGVEGAVIGCKCMGKCRDGPNIRVLRQKNGDFAGMNCSYTPSSNSLCIGVGLEDVGVIVANLFGEERKDLGLMAA